MKIYRLGRFVGEESIAVRPELSNKLEPSRIDLTTHPCIATSNRRMTTSTTASGCFISSSALEKINVHHEDLDGKRLLVEEMR
jgi:hypothetical protein